MAPPTVIMHIVRPMSACKAKKIPIRALPGDIGALLIAILLLINPLSVHPFIEGTAVVKYSVKDHPHTPAVDLFYHLGKKCIAGLKIHLVRHSCNVTEGLSVCPSCLHLAGNIIDNLPIVGIDVIIILNIIFMIRGRHKQRIKIDHVHAQILQIVHLVEHTLQIPAVKLPHAHGCRIFVPVFHLHGLITDVLVFIGQHVIGRVAVIETVHIDLIENRTLRPVRRLKSRNQLEMIVFIDILTDTPRIIVAVDPAHPYLEIVGQLLVIKLYRIGIIIKIIIRLRL